MKVFLVCLSTGGAHESAGVFSVWSTREGAIAEAQRLSEQYPANNRVQGDPIDQIQIAVAEVDTPSDDAGVTWVPDGWRKFADQT